MAIGIVDSSVIHVRGPRGGRAGSYPTALSWPGSTAFRAADYSKSSSANTRVATNYTSAHRPRRRDHGLTGWLPVHTELVDALIAAQSGLCPTADRSRAAYEQSRIVMSDQIDRSPAPRTSY
ncbi:hypothetical protein [Nocardia salmonicida]|uniref:hypothetical protein n=1 Tax=Nocardia salmonicida TaxID=53431 RepID=UPI0033DBBF5E